MNRRGFLAALIGGATLDPERLLWRPGAKLISIPKWRPTSGGLWLFEPHTAFYRAYEAAWDQARLEARMDIQFIEGIALPAQPSVVVTGGSYARIPFVNYTTRWPERRSV